MLFSELEKITGGEIIRLDDDRQIDKFSIDSRKIIGKETEVFVAIKGNRNDGHDYLQDLPVENYLIEDGNKLPKQGNVILVESGTAALQAIARHHREQFNYPVLGITGSNAKTTVKEWLFEITTQEKRVIKSPKSYNSQVGVPLSVLGMGPHDLGIFEAGISEVGEMQRLAHVIQPTLGLFTNIGEAHSRGFESHQQKIDEKCLLFESCDSIICRLEHSFIFNALSTKFPEKIITWSTKDPKANYFIALDGGHLSIPSANLSLSLPFQNKEQIENLIHAVICALELGISAHSIVKAAGGLKPVSMRLELKKAVNNCYLIDDSYNNDLLGLEVALDFMNEQNPHQQKVLILSDLIQSSLPDETLKKRIADLIEVKKVNHYYHVGSDNPAAERSFPTTDDFIRNMPNFQNETILIKGARSFVFEKIVERLEEKTHGTCLEINFDALRRNLNQYRRKLSPMTKLMVMVKALAYGSGLSEIASFLQHERVDYLGVAYLDEAIALRKKGITLPIMIMNPGEVDFSHFDHYQLEPEIYSISILRKFISSKVQSGIHLKLETGMNRLGLAEQELDEAIDLLGANPNVPVLSLLTHFSSSDLPEEDNFTKFQAECFEHMAGKIESALGYKPIRHVLNSAGILRFPHYHFNMVRLGIGLHGFDATKTLDLEPTSRLKSYISQIKKIKAGESIGYSRKGAADSDMTIAVIPIGYSDGYLRVFGNGKAWISINGHQARTIGNICMDMCMVDVTGLKVNEGDEVVIFGDLPGIEELANWAETIPYEILTNISERVQRIYVSE